MILAVIREFSLRSVNLVIGTEEVVLGQIFLQIGVLWNSSDYVITLKPRIH
jgi:hypothetical protein